MPRSLALAPLALLAACATATPAPGPAAPADTLDIALTDPRDSFAVTLSRELGGRAVRWQVAPGRDPLELLAAGAPALVTRGTAMAATTPTMVTTITNSTSVKAERRENPCPRTRAHMLSDPGRCSPDQKVQYCA